MKENNSYSFLLRFLSASLAAGQTHREHHRMSIPTSYLVLLHNNVLLTDRSKVLSLKRLIVSVLGTWQ